MNTKNSGRTIVMLGAIACLLLALSGTAGIATAADSVLYVKPSATGTGDCGSWANACTLQTALGVAAAGDEVWVAEGTHKPTDGTDRAATFKLKNGVALYGGFAGTETNRDERDWTVYETILSGDIGAEGDNSDNSYHVGTGGGTDATAVLDGFTITGGNADHEGEPSEERGGGMYNFGGSPTLANVTFTGNSAVGGGGMCNFENSNPMLTNVTFSGNTARSGGGMHNLDSNPMLTNVTFSGNTVANWGGGMYNCYSSDPMLTNVTFSGNSANEFGGGMYNCYSSNPMLTNVTFNGNFANYGGGGMRNFENSNPMLTNVTFSDNSTWGDGGGMHNLDSSGPTLTGVIFTGNSATTGGGVFNHYSSPILTDVTFSSNSATTGGGMRNADSSPTLTNVTFSSNSAYIGGGMYNHDSSSPMLINITFNRNSADSLGGGMYNGYSSSPTLVNGTFSGNSANNWGGGMYNLDSNPTLANSILWGNTAADGAQIYNDSSTPTISYSLVEDSGGSGPGWDANLGTDGGGNIDADPQFVDAANGDLHLQATSPAIDAGDNDALPADTLDLDGDGNTAEPLPFDLDGNPRVVNGTVDMGAYEAQEVQMEVSVDIKPGSDPNSINCNNENEVIAVAILTSEDFDATTVDHTTVTFEGASETHVHKKSGEPRRHEEDVDYDGDADLVFHFRLGDTGLTCDSIGGTLTGETFDGQVIEGTDAVRMID